MSHKLEEALDVGGIWDHQCHHVKLWFTVSSTCHCHSPYNILQCARWKNYITTKRGQATSVHPSSMCFSFFSTWNAWYVAQMMKRSQGHLSLCQRCALPFLYLSLGLDWLRQKPVQPRLYSSVVRPSQVWNNKRTHRLTELQLFPQNPSDTRLSKQ